MHVSPAQEGQIHHHHHHHYRRCLPLTALLINRHRHHHPHQQDNYHNQCTRCQSSVQLSTQPSPLDVASPDSSYIFLEKGNMTTSKFSESFNRINVQLPRFSPRFLQYQHTLSSINSIQNAKNFLCKVLITVQFLFCQFLTNYLLKGEYKIFFYSCTYLRRVKQFPSYRLQVTDARTS